MGLSDTPPWDQPQERTVSAPTISGYPHQHRWISPSRTNGRETSPWRPALPRMTSSPNRMQQRGSASLEPAGQKAAGSPAVHGAGRSRPHCPHGKIGPEEGALLGAPHGPLHTCLEQGQAGHRSQASEPNGWDEGAARGHLQPCCPSGPQHRPGVRGNSRNPSAVCQNLGWPHTEPTPNPGRLHRTPRGTCPGSRSCLCPQYPPRTPALRPDLPPLLREGNLDWHPALRPLLMHAQGGGSREEWGASSEGRGPC